MARSEWEAICRGMESAFRGRRYEQGALEAIAHATRLLQRHFPPREVNANELPDKPVLL